MFCNHAVVFTCTAFSIHTIPRDKAVRTVACSAFCVGYFTTRWLVYLNLTCSTESLFTLAEEVVCPVLLIHAIGNKAVFHVLTVGLFCVVFEVVEVNLANGERESLDVLLTLCGHIGSDKSLVWTSD